MKYADMNLNKYIVTGNPVSHSKSPFIMNYLFSESNLNSAYRPLLASSFDKAVEFIKEIDICGANITSPFKNAAKSFANILSDETVQIEGINTLVNKNGELSAYNTDIDGARQCLLNAKARIESRVLVIGAGAAARAAIIACLSLKCNVTISNRTHSKAIDSAIDFNISIVEFEQIYADNYDIIISAVPNLNIEILNICSSDFVFINTDYRNTSINESLKKKGIKIVKGEQWLFGQAEKAFEHFTGLDCKLPANFDKIINIKCLNNIIYLSGFSGSGKSTIGKLLSKIKKIEFIDLDEEIEKHLSMSIPKIFETYGENYFREVESKILKKISSRNKLIVSLGGGAVKNNFKIISQTGYNIWIYSPIQTCLDRIDFPSRPMIKELGLEGARELFKNRIDSYFHSADLIVCGENTALKTAELICSDLTSLRL